VACDTTQSLGAQCTGGKCTYTGCQAGWVDCDQGSSPDSNGCESSLTSTSSCGACGNACDMTTSLGASCEPTDAGGFACTYTGCAIGYADCVPAPPDVDGCETSLTTASNCGACGVACDTTHSVDPTCDDGTTCNYGGCKPGFADCSSTPPDTDGCEKAVPTDSCDVCSEDGGTCDMTHSLGANCDVSDAGANAICTYTGCANNYADCNRTSPNTNGCETALTSITNCGQCGRACDTKTSTGASCGDGGSCTYAGCENGWMDCKPAAPNTNGCETSLTSTSSCAGCNNACDTSTGAATCNGKTCAYTCNSGRSDCNAATAPDTDGCECATPGCCSTKCQTIHSNGEGQNFYDCVASGTHNEAQALEACAAFTGASSACAASQSTAFCPFGFVKSACGSSGGTCYCWQYSGHYVGTVEVGATNCKPSCGATGDPTWN
jgi:hypothetical protein